jgi:3-deoxy-D-manno-octulosonate 8-phosphate phosphatase (KDO 8-P phosphatase)
LPTIRPKRAVLRRIKLLLLDVDGVLTDGGLYYSRRGEEMKKFNTKDGYGIVKLQQLGVQVGIITGRVSKIVEKRAEELGITEVHQTLDDKVKAYRSMTERLKLTDAEVAYIGDDEPDVPVLRCVGFSAAPADAVAVVLQEVDYICQRKGGKGAVREIVDLILNAQA